MHEISQISKQRAPFNLFRTVSAFEGVLIANNLSGYAVGSVVLRHAEVIEFLGNEDS